MVHRRGEEEGRKNELEDGLVELEVQVARLRKRSMVAAAAFGGENTVGEEEAGAGVLAIQENVSQHNLLLLDSFKHAARKISQKRDALMHITEGANFKKSLG